MFDAILTNMSSYYYDDELGYHRRKTVRNSAIVIGLVIVWYLSAVVTITTSKEVMNSIKFPFFLCTTQFVFASIISTTYLKISGSYIPLHPSISSLVLQISVGYTFGFILTNSAFSIGEHAHCSNFVREFDDTIGRHLLCLYKLHLHVP